MGKLKIYLHLLKAHYQKLIVFFQLFIVVSPRTIAMPGFPVRGGGGGRPGGRGGRGGGRGGRGRGGPRGGSGGKRKRKPNWLQVAEAEQLNIKRLKEAEKKEEEDELEEEGEVSEEENAFDSLLGVIGDGRTEDIAEEEDGEDEDEEEIVNGEDRSSDKKDDDDG